MVVYLVETFMLAFSQALNKSGLSDFAWWLTLLGIALMYHFQLSWLYSKVTATLERWNWKFFSFCVISKLSKVTLYDMFQHAYGHIALCNFDICIQGRNCFFLPQLTLWCVVYISFNECSQGRRFFSAPAYTLMCRFLGCSVCQVLGIYMT